MVKKEQFLNELGCKVIEELKNRAYENLTGRKIDRLKGSAGAWVSTFELKTLKEFKDLMHGNNITLNPDAWDFCIRNILKICEPLFDQANILNIENKLGYAEIYFDNMANVINNSKVNKILNDVTLVQSDSNIKVNKIITDELIEIANPVH